MFKSSILLGICLSLCSVVPAKLFCQPVGTPISFNYTLNTSLRTSAGVYSSDSTLIRTLWSNEQKSTGTYTSTWDGKDDDGNLAPNGNYHIEVLSNNVQYEWGGIIGNSSDSNVGHTVHHPHQGTTAMVQVGTAMYYAVGYAETSDMHHKFNIGTPGVKTTTLHGGGLCARYLATDGNKVYYAGQFITYAQGYFNIMQGVTAIVPNPTGLDVLATFSGGFNFTPAGSSFVYNVFDSTYNKILPINIYEHTGIWGLAVQKTGNYIFTARPYENVLTCSNKTTGAFVATTTLNGIREIGIQDNTFLWGVTNGNVVSKRTINSDGTVVATPVLTLAGLNEPVALAVNDDGSRVAVADRGGSGIHQVKIYNTNTGALILTIGRNESYSNPSAYDDKFFFINNKKFDDDDYGQVHAFLAFQTDGSIWIGDYGNSRAQHFSSTGIYIDNLQSLGYGYSLQVDANNGKRVWFNTLEFEVDYTKPQLLPTNGSWKLKRNWGYNLNKVTARVNTFFPGITTLSNGRTYALGNAADGGDLQLIELDSVTGVRYIGNTISYEYWLQHNGDLWQYVFTGFYNNGTGEWRKRTLTGFDSNNNPVYSAPAAIANITYTPELKLNVIPTIGFQQIFNNGNILHWFFGRAGSGGPGESYYHLATIKPGVQKIAWKTAKQTHRSYQGDFPADGRYDIGNYVQNPGNKARVMEKSIFWGYNGEFWKNSQTNYYNHVYENGLQLGLFGTNLKKAEEDGEMPVAGGAGNAATFSVVKQGNDYYLYHCDEGQHGGIHQWKISNLSSIQVQNIPITKTGTPPAPVLDYIDLMAGLPFDSVLSPGTTAGWSFSAPGVDKVKTSHSSYLPDIDLYLYGWDVNTPVTKPIGATLPLINWKITGKLAFPGGGENTETAFEVLDNSNRVIARISKMTVNQIPRVSANSTTSFGNFKYYQLHENVPFSITTIGSNISITYRGITINTTPLNAQADITRPTTIRMQAVVGIAGKSHEISVDRLRFYKNFGLGSGHFRSKGSGLWKNVSSWQSSIDSTNWVDATSIPDSNTNSIAIYNSHIITLTDTVAVDQLTIQNTGGLRVAPNALLRINDGPGSDIVIAGSASMLIQSDATGTGRIGNSSGTVSGNVTVERYISAYNNAAYQLLAPSVNTAGGPKPFIRSNWQEGQNNGSVFTNSNNIPHYGIHITGSMSGANGFDATSVALSSSLMYYNQSATNPAWMSAPNTDATNFDVKKGYLVYIRGDRSTDLHLNTNTSNTTLRTTGNIATGTQTFTNLEGSSRSSLVTNPYACPIDWSVIYNDASTTNATNFENYYTYWDPNVGISGGYVTVNANGTKSAATNATTEIQPGQAFFIKAKPGVASPAFVVKESHKSGAANLDVFRIGAREQLRTGLYFTDANGKRIMADGVNAVFDTSFSIGTDSNDAEEIANWDENVAITRLDKMMSIEGRPLIDTKDTLQLRVQRLRMQNYEWQFEPISFSHPGLRAYLEDKYTNSRTEISLSSVSVITFSVNMAAASSAADRFRIVFGINISLPIALGSVKAYQKGTGNQVEWTNSNETNVSRYEIEKSADGRNFTKAGTVVPNTSGSLNNTYGWFDAMPIAGNNYYRIKTLDKNGVVNYSNIVIVKIGGKQEGFEIYPNPLTGNHITIQFVNMKKGDYTVSIINAVGQKLVSKRISHSGGSASQSLLLDASLPAGSYNLQITSFGSTINKKIIR